MYSVCYISHMIKNIPTKELADFIGVTDGFASQIKNGWRKLPAKYCITVSEKFNISLYDLRPDIYPESSAPLKHIESAAPIVDVIPKRRITDIKENTAPTLSTLFKRRATDRFE